MPMGDEAASRRKRSTLAASSLVRACTCLLDRLRLVSEFGQPLGASAMSRSLKRTERPAPRLEHHPGRVLHSTQIEALRRRKTDSGQNMPRKMWSVAITSEPVTSTRQSQ